MRILSPYILFGQGRKGSHPIMIGSFLAIWLANLPEMATSDWFFFLVSDCRNQDVLQTVSTTARYDPCRLQGCDVGWFGGIETGVQIERVCLRLSKYRSWWHHNSVGTTFPLQLWRYNEFEFVWRPLQLRQWYGEIQSQLPVFEMWPVVETCWEAAQTWTDLYGECYLIHHVQDIAWQTSPGS